MLTSALPASGATTARATVLWADNFNFIQNLRDQNGVDLTGGDDAVLGDGEVYQLGYFDGLNAGTAPSTVGSGLWDMFVPLTGDDSLNPTLVTTLGDTNDGPFNDTYVNLTTIFDADPLAGQTLPGTYPVRLGVRIFNGMTVDGSTHYNIVTADSPDWVLYQPGSGAGGGEPLPALLDLDVGSALWEGTPFETSEAIPPSTGTVIWQDAGTDWSQATSWDNSGGGSAPPAPGDIARFGNDATITNQPDLNGTTQSVAGIEIDNTGADYTISDSGSGMLTIGVSGIDLDGAGVATLGTVGSEIHLVLGDNQTWDLEANATLDYAESGNQLDFGNNTLTKAGAGTLILNESSYANIGAANDVIVQAGTLQLEANPGTTAFTTQLETATISILGGLLELTIDRAATHTGTLEVDNTLNGAITGPGDIVLKKYGTGLATIGATISGTGNVIVNDTGDTIRFSGNNNYTGTTTVTNGTLLIDGNQSSANGNVNVAGTLGGAGTVGGATFLNTGSSLAPATNGTVGALSFASNLTSNGSTWLIDIAGTSDVVNVTGDLNLTGTTLTTTGSGTGTFVIANYGTLTGTFDNRPGGWTIDYNYLGGNQIALTAVPEPSTVVPLVALLSPWVLRRRRRKGRARP